jgi:hypothetical protein
MTFNITQAQELITCAGSIRQLYLQSIHSDFVTRAAHIEPDFIMEKN